MDASDLRRQLPHGLGDLFFEQAAAKVRLEGLLGQCFSRWGYQRIFLPTFEYFESIATGASAHARQDVYRFFDREGELLALRTDMTVSTARVVGTKLYDQPLPLRFFYIGNVFRYDEPQAGRRREFTQAGIELIGADTPEADAEVLAIAGEALQSLDVSRFQITLGQVSFLKAMLSETPLRNGELALLEQVIGRRNQVELDALLKGLGLPEPVVRAIRTLPRLYGGPQIIAQARGLAGSNAGALQALERLEAVYALLQAEGLAEHVFLDLAEVRSMDYYTGITFHGYVEGQGFHLCSGGRYDGLIANFGPSLPAVGFALGVERAMLAAPRRVRSAPQVLFADDAGGVGRRLAARARALGLRAELDVLRRDAAALKTYAASRGIGRVVWPDADGTLLLDDAQGSRRVSAEDLCEEMATWND